jgi:DNA-binding PadR family transcriptional regulator
MPKLRQADLLPLFPADYHILLELVDEPLHGYAIARKVRDATEGMISLEAANLQRTVRKLIRNGLADETAWRPAPEMDDPRRRYYVITDLGREVLAAESVRMRRAAAVAESKDLIPNPEGVR